MAAYVGRGIHGQVVEALGYRIVSGRIAQGDTIDVRSVAEEMDISLTVMRESLKVLAGKGLIDSRQKRGTFVQPDREWNFLDADVIRWRVAGGHGAKLLGDLAEVRAIIEPPWPGTPPRAGASGISSPWRRPWRPWAVPGVTPRWRPERTRPFTARSSGLRETICSPGSTCCWSPGSASATASCTHTGRATIPCPATGRFWTPSGTPTRSARTPP